VSAFAPLKQTYNFVENQCLSVFIRGFQINNHALRAQQNMKIKATG
jgi:hypothetical protein